jgi:gamma-F420-2:alpha-L-glutamate ligase
MLGWLLYKKTDDTLKPEVYEIRKLVEIASGRGINIRVLSPDQIDIIVFREDRNSILVDEVPTALPDFILPRMGAGTSYFALAVIRHLERLGVYSVNSSQSIENVRDKLYTLDPGSGQSADSQNHPSEISGRTKNRDQTPEIPCCG